MDHSRTEDPSHGQPGLEVILAEHHYHRSHPEVLRTDDNTHKETLPVVSAYIQDSDRYVAANEAPEQAKETRPGPGDVSG